MLKDNCEDLSTDVEHNWKVFKETVIQATENTIGRRRGKPSEKWISDETWKVIDKRKQLKSIMNKNANDETRRQEYRKADKLVKNMTREGKRN